MILPDKVNPGFTYVMQSWNYKPQLGVNSLRVPVVKIGRTNIPWQRLRQYRQTGAEMVFDKVWRGEMADCAAMERMALFHFSANLLKNQNSGMNCKEVVVQDIQTVISYMDELAASFFPSVDLSYENYNATCLLGCPFRLPAVFPKLHTSGGAVLPTLSTYDELFA